jgi:hypothetical protein
MYRSLHGRNIVETADLLCRRIDERFPDSGLSRVGQETLVVARESVIRAQRLREPYWLLRIAVVVVVAALLASIVAALTSVPIKADGVKFYDLIPAVDAAMNELVFFGIAVIFLVSAETRWKRSAALRGLHQLRSIAHVIDMHQLTKDPHSMRSPGQSTPSSPKRMLTPYELVRYLDYCSEMLSLISKLSALYVQYLRDPVVLDAVNDVEALAGGLSQKIWQKITVMEMQTEKASSISRSATSPERRPAEDSAGPTTDATEGT